jgi:hypothetical protein
MKTPRLTITMPQPTTYRRKDRKTHTAPQLYKEETGFDKPTTFRLTPEQNQQFLTRLRSRRAQ